MLLLLIDRKKLQETSFSKVKNKLKKKNNYFFPPNIIVCNFYFLPQESNHRVTVLWALDLAQVSVYNLCRKYPQEHRPQKALNAAWAWAKGEIKMREAQRKILDCHAFAKELDCQEDIALCHAVGQAASTVHSAKHALGYPIYELSAIVYRMGADNCYEAIEKRLAEYSQKLLFYNNQPLNAQNDKWVAFMQK